MVECYFVNWISFLKVYNSIGIVMLVWIKVVFYFYYWCVFWVNFIMNKLLEVICLEFCCILDIFNIVYWMFFLR